MAGPWEKYQSEAPADGPWSKYATPTAPTTTVMQDIKQGVGNLAAGAVRGAGSIGATLLAPLDMAKDAMNGKGLSLESNRERRASMDAGLQTMGAEPDSLMYQGGKLAGEVAGTAGAVGAVANVAARVPAVAAAAPNLLQAIRTSGMTAGNGGAVANALTRATGGAIAGGVSAGMVNPADVGTGASVGAVLPGILQGLGKAGGAIVNAVKDARTPKEVAAALKLADAAGLSADDLAVALNRQGPQLIEGYQATVPQLLQNPAISQFQRTLKTAGSDALGSAERLQQQQYLQTLNRVAPTGLTVQDAAARAGGAIESFAIPARKEAGKAVSRAFEAVDPFNETQLFLPIDAMRKAQSKFLGDGTFGTGTQAQKAIQEAERIGSQELPAVKPIAQSAVNKGVNLEQAVRAAGGLRGGSGELRDLGIRQSGTTGLINNKSGQSADLLAEEMHRRGFIPDADPATLYDALRNGAGRKTYASDFADASFAQQAERAMGDAPGAERIAKAVPFQTIQNLRSSIGEVAQQASLAGSNKEAAALKSMVSAIDDKIKSASNGGAGVDEFFAADMAAQYKQARAMHAEKIARFETGPQIGMFRQGSDGNAVIQGAEIPGRFYSGKRSQVEDINAFKRLVGEGGDSLQLIKDLQSYATTEGANTATAAGNLSSKYGNWLASRSGANKELFSPSQNAALKAIDDAIKTATSAENLGRVTGSDTAQKLNSLQSLGLLDSRLVNVLANKIPLVGNFTGPMVEGLRNTAKQSNNQIMDALLADPQALAEALKKVGKAEPNPLSRLAIPGARQLAYRAAPALAADH